MNRREAQRRKSQVLVLALSALCVLLVYLILKSITPVRVRPPKATVEDGHDASGDRTLFSMWRNDVESATRAVAASPSLRKNPSLDAVRFWLKKSRPDVNRGTQRKDRGDDRDGMRRRGEDERQRGVPLYSALDSFKGHATEIGINHWELDVDAEATRPGVCGTGERTATGGGPR